MRTGRWRIRLVARFFRYLAVTSQSDARATTVPSTPGQWDMVRLLESELKQFGLTEVHLDDHAVLTARLPGTVAGAPRIGFCARCHRYGRCRAIPRTSTRKAAIAFHRC